MRTNGAVGMVVVAMITGCAHGVDSAPSRAWVGTQPVASQDAVVSADRRPGESKNATSPKKPAEAPGLVAQNGPALVSRSGEVSARLVRLMSGHAVHPVPRAPPLALHAWFKDPVFGTCIRRISDPSQWPGAVRIRHYYSKANPWNADNTKAILMTGKGGTLLYDAKSWTPIRELKIASSDAEIQWHPTDPRMLYYLDFVRGSSNVRAMFRYDVENDAQVMLHDFAEYQTARGNMEGNLDGSGRYYALLGMKDDNDIEAFVYDLENDSLSPRVRVTRKMADDWISVTPSGRYVVMMGGDRSRIYDINMKHLRDLPRGSFGHGDLCLTSDRRDVLVYDGADHELDGNRNINIADLATGDVRIGTRIGWRTTSHVSCRNIDLPGWALISTQGPDKDYPNHDFEVFWLKLDGSREVRRVAHHHSSREDGGYFAEQHAVTNRDGSMIIFASNWGGTTVSDYLIDLLRLPGSSGSCG